MQAYTSVNAQVMGAPSHGTQVNYKTRKAHCNGQALPLYLVQGHWQQQSLLCTFIEFGNNDTKDKCLSNAVVSTAGSHSERQLPLPLYESHIFNGSSISSCQVSEIQKVIFACLS